MRAGRTSRDAQPLLGSPGLPCAGHSFRELRFGRLNVLDVDRPPLPHHPSADGATIDWMEIRRRPRDHLQNLAGRGLLLQRLRQLGIPYLQLVEQAHVLDGDDRLGGEGFQDLDLLVREQTRLRSHDRDRANGVAVL